MLSPSQKWVLYNGMLGIFIYFGLFEGVLLAQILALLGIWFIILLSPLVLSTDVVKAIVEAKGPKVNDIVMPTIDLLTDVAIVAALAYTGWYITATFFAIQIAIMLKSRALCKTMYREISDQKNG
jgi:hypothetical protein